ncbi:MAG: DUF2249 domain-containing protein [bacterium]|nr:DUF2249 domain-containing protein [bacterium]
MKPINANTKIATLIKEHPGALEAIISLSSKFEKLRNPILRKLMAARTSIQMASKIGGVTADDFLKKLKPLGFIIDNENIEVESVSKKSVPVFFQNIKTASISELDVRNEIELGSDPLTLILSAIKHLKPGQVLKLINSFEPIPLILLLEKQGFESHTETINDNLIFTYFHQSKVLPIKETIDKNANEGWEEILAKFKDKMETIDVRNLEMPLPMISILEALDELPNGKALHVIHKRIPVFLLPELSDRKFDYRIKEEGENEVYLLIYKD